MTGFISLLFVVPHCFWGVWKKTPMKSSGSPKSPVQPSRYTLPSWPSSERPR